MSSEEAGIISVLIMAVAIHAALSARVDVTKVPWLKIVRHPTYFGGWFELTRHFLILLLWILQSVILGLIIASFIKLLEPLVHQIYSWIKYEATSTGVAGLATLVGGTLALYLYWARKARYLVTKSRVYIPKQLFGDHDSEPLPTGIVIPSLYRGDSRRFTFMRFLFYLIPNLLAPTYAYFARRTGVIISGCARLLTDEFGVKIPTEFYEFHRAVSGDPRLADLDRALHGCRSQVQAACTILNAMIRMEGYSATRHYINNYVNVKQKNEEVIVEQRGVVREPPGNPVLVELVSGGQRAKGIILDCSLDGSGLSVVTYKRAEAGNCIALHIGGRDLDCKWIYNRAVPRYSRDHYTHRIGLSVVSKENRELLMRACGLIVR